MRRFEILLLFLTSVVCLPAGVSHAATRDLRLCFELNLDFEDGDAWVGDDYLNAPGTYPAIGVHVKVESNQTPDVPFDDKLNSVTPPYHGCTPVLTLDDDQTYLISFWSYAWVNLNNVYVYNNPNHNQVFYTNLWQYFDPDDYAAGSTVYATTPVRRHWNILGAAIWALYRSNAGLAGETYKFFDEAYQDGGTCFCEGAVYLTEFSTGRKYLITHEMGHAVQRYANPEGGNVKDYDSRPINCFNDRVDEVDGDSVIDHDSWFGESDQGSHEMNSREYQSAAAVEGLAHFFAAAAWNAPGQDCWFGYWQSWIDWNLDRVRQADEQTGLVDCADGAHVSPAVEAADYFHARCFSGYYSVGNAVGNRATPYDWLRFWWDMVSFGGLSVGDVFDMWDEADPHDWNANDVDCVIAPCNAVNDPASRFASAATTLGFPIPWAVWSSYNGVAD
ncbi:hypothetical protein L6R50_00320 [Myxococcota bacterium]|nr:hypothetical protein [Myxococcota bacterium]